MGKIYGAARNLEDLIKKHTKIQLDIYFIKPCIKENLIPNFAKVNVAIKHGMQKIEMKIVHAVM